MPKRLCDPRTPFLFFATGGRGLWLGAFGKVWLFRCQSGIRELWLEAFDKSEFFRCQSRSFRPRRRRVEESFSALVKQGKLYFFKSSQTSRERGNQLFRRVVVPSPLNPHPFLAATGGIPRAPYAITRNSWSFAPAPKNAVHFLYGAALHRPGEHPWTPVRRFFFLQPAVWGFGVSHSPKIHNESIS